MKKSFVGLLTITAVLFGTISCNGDKKAKEDAAKETEDAAVIAGSISKSLLTEELKTETIQLLHDLPDSDIPYLISTGEITVNVGDAAYMLPVAKAAELTSMSQKARACGIYLADHKVLAITQQPTAEIEGVLAKLTADLNISYLLDILKESAPKDASKEQVQAFHKAHEDKIIKALADDDKIDIAMDILGGLTAEYACLMANPSLVVKGDAPLTGLSDGMEKRIEMLGEITTDLSEYYPEMKNLKETIAPLKGKLTSIQTARDANADITGIRNSLVK
ncbi:MAG: hypothetical protein LBV72_10890 [Tannerella sp.]|jgi:hypothetical protein|nr:hypothetical protein [Tannerella sp.]